MTSEVIDLIRENSYLHQLDLEARKMAVTYKLFTTLTTQQYQLKKKENLKLVVTRPATTGTF